MVLSTVAQNEETGCRGGRMIATSELRDTDLALIEINTKSAFVLRLIEEVRKMRKEVMCSSVRIADLECEAETSVCRNGRVRVVSPPVIPSER